MTNLEKISKVWDALYDKQNAVEQVVERFFHPEYKQCINGVELNRDEYVAHVSEQRRNLDSVTFRYEEHLSDANKLFAIYYVNGKNASGNDLDAEVIAHFEFMDDMVYRIHGQVRVMHGDPADADMVSE